MRLTRARMFIARRVYWLVAKGDAAHEMERGEIAALELALRLIAEKVAPPPEDVLADIRSHQIARAQHIMSERLHRCTCERCPVHGAGRKAAE